MAVARPGATGSPTADDGPQLLEAARYQLLSYLRTNRFLAMLILTVLVTALIGGIVIYLQNRSGGPAFLGTVDQFLGFALSFVALLIVLTASFLGGDA
ncbi:MAG: hypothetical protein L3K08_02370, partial [Thermoplasmata archaeon]|nr:hypothetical protein [Thermoplasmata archaeon]